MTIYVETSAAAKLLVEEKESAALQAYLDEQASADVALISSQLLETELRRTAPIYTEAGLLPGCDLRSLDALHVTVALRVDVEAILSYDVRRVDAAGSVGLEVLAPS